MRLQGNFKGLTPPIVGVRISDPTGRLLYLQIIPFGAKGACLPGGFWCNISLYHNLIPFDSALAPLPDTNYEITLPYYLQLNEDGTIPNETVVLPSIPRVCCIYFTLYASTPPFTHLLYGITMKVVTFFGM